MSQEVTSECVDLVKTSHVSVRIQILTKNFKAMYSRLNAPVFYTLRIFVYINAT
jgi:hypothetical protein